LTEALDYPGGPVYSQATLQVAGRQAHIAGGAPKRDGDEGPEDVAGPQSQGLRVVAFSE